MKSQYCDVLKLCMFWISCLPKSTKFIYYYYYYNIWVHQVQKVYYSQLLHTALYNTYCTNSSCLGVDLYKATQIKAGGDGNRWFKSVFSHLLNCPYHRLISTNSIHHNHHLFINLIWQCKTTNIVLMEGKKIPITYMIIWMYIYMHSNYS